jgi:hypothetical protein
MAPMLATQDAASCADYAGDANVKTFRDMVGQGRKT